MTLREPSAKHRYGRKAVMLALAIGVIFAAAAPSHAARVSGTLTGYENSAPQKDRYLHFENRVTHDIYMALTADDGSFGAQLPPGVYRLRAERGAILTGPITVGAADATLGQVSDLAPYAPARLCALEYLAPAIVTSPAPSTANIMTLDTTTPLPPVAPAVSGLSADLPTSSAPPYSVE